MKYFISQDGYKIYKVDENDVVTGMILNTGIIHHVAASGTYLDKLGFWMPISETKFMMLYNLNKFR